MRISSFPPAASLALAIVSLLSLSVHSARAGDPGESSLDENSVQIDLAEEFPVAELNEIHFAPSDEEAAFEESKNSAIGCIPDYIARRKETVRRALFHPLIAPAALPLGMAAGVEAGILVGGNTASGSILASSAGLVVGFYAVAAALGVHEAIQLIDYFHTRRMITLLRDAEAGRPDGTPTRMLLRKIESRGNGLTAENIQAFIREKNANRELCDGSLTGHRHSKKLRKRLVSFHKLAQILSESAQ